MNLLKVISRKIKEYKNKTIIDDFCDRVNKEFTSIVGIDPQLYLVYDDSDKSYYYKVRQGFKQQSIDIRFDIYYDANFDLSYVYIEWFEVNPKGKGIGRQVINSFVNNLKYVKAVDKVFLDPVIGDAERFWRVCGFRSTNGKDKKRNSSRVNCYGSFVYDIPKKISKKTNYSCTSFGIAIILFKMPNRN